jgi:hypothetical protein
MKSSPRPYRNLHAFAAVPAGPALPADPGRPAGDLPHLVHVHVVPDVKQAGKPKLPGLFPFCTRVAEVLGLGEPFSIELREDDRLPSLGGDSWQLSVALLLAYAHCPAEDDFPPWIVSSGCLGVGPDLRLGPTGQIAQKVRFCLEHPEAVRSIIGRYLGGEPEEAETCYGPRERRAVPGEVRLLLTSADVEHADLEALGARMTTLPLGELRARRFAGLHRWIEERTGGGLLVVQLRSVWQAVTAFCQGRYDDLCPAAWRADEQALRVAWVPRSAGVATVSREYLEQTAREIVADVERAMEGEPGAVAELKAIGETARRYLDCPMGHFRAPTHAYPDYLHVFASFGETDHDDVLLDLPGTQGMIGKAVLERAPLLAATHEEFETYADFAPDGEKKRPYRAGSRKRIEAYDALRRRLGSVAVFPLLHGGECHGVMGLFRFREGGFTLLGEAVAAALARLAARTLSAHLAEEGLSFRQLLSREVRESHRLLARLDLSQIRGALEALAQALADKALPLSRARHVAVHLLDPDGGEFRLMAAAGSPLEGAAAYRPRPLELHFAGELVGTLVLEYGKQEEEDLMDCGDAILEDLGVLGADYAQKAHHLILAARLARLGRSPRDPPARLTWEGVPSPSRAAPVADRPWLVGGPSRSPAQAGGT